MKTLILTALLALTATSIVANADAPVVFGHVYAGHANETFGFDQAVLGASYKYDEQYSAEVAVDAAAPKDASILFLANAKAKGLLLSSDSLHDTLIVGRHYGTYTDFVYDNLGTQWIGANFAQGAKLQSETNDGFVYGAKYHALDVQLSASNSAVAHKSIYGGLASLRLAEGLLHVAGGYQYNAATEDALCQGAVIVHKQGAKLALEYAHQHNKVDAVVDRTSYAATGTYAVNDRYGAYAQYMTGDAAFQAVSLNKYSVSAGPTIAANKYVKVAGLFTSSRALDNSYANGIGLRLAASF